MNGGILNGKAIIFPKPAVMPSINASGSVSVRVNLDEKGNVISAKAVSGNICLGEAAVQAAKKAKFSQTFLSGIPVKVSGIVVYNFSAKR
jgi:protein TonB